MMHKFHPVAAIPGQFSPLGLTLPPDLSFEQWQAAVAQLVIVARGCMWWLGDALHFASHKWGKRYEQALRTTGYDYGTLANASYVASRIESSRRREKLSFGHHQVVAPLDPEQQDEMLDKAESEHLSVQELRRAVRHRPAEADAKLKSVGPRGCGNLVGPYRCCTFVRGDCETLLADLPPRSVSAVVTDPPYGINAESWDCKVPYHLLGHFLNYANGPVVWFGAAPAIAEAYEEFNPKPDRQLIWAPSFTCSHVMANGLAFRYHPIYAWRLPNAHAGPSWDVLNVPTEGGKNWWTHRGTKPVALMEQLVGFVPEGGLVLDPFAGSGSTLVAAAARNRHFLGFEISAAYCDVIAARLWRPDADVAAAA
jgi:hypothetical protein